MEHNPWKMVEGLDVEGIEPSEPWFCGPEPTSSHAHLVKRKLSHCESSGWAFPFSLSDSTVFSEATGLRLHFCLWILGAKMPNKLGIIAVGQYGPAGVQIWCRLRGSGSGIGAANHRGHCFFHAQVPSSAFSA